MEEVIQEPGYEPATSPKRQTASSHTVKTTSAIIILISAISSHAFSKATYFHYNIILIVVFSLIFFTLNIYNYKKKHTSSLIIMWHQLTHWAAIMLLAYITSLFINTGMLSNQQGGHVLLILIATTLFSIGLYTDICFMLCGLGVTASLFIGAHAYPHQLLLNTLICITLSVTLYFLNKLTARQ
jgi:uncharacterized membrane protein AbrB (regulator of aidB expression)